MDIIDRHGSKNDKNQSKAVLLKEKLDKFKYVSIEDIK